MVETTSVRTVIDDDDNNDNPVSFLFSTLIIAKIKSQNGIL